jgi:DNA-binding XRE family transcriptional regulator
VVNDHGVTVEELEGKKTEEQIEQERLDNELRVARELQKRADQALLATYLSVDEIKLHRDRRVELFQAQSRVTELYLRNLERRLAGLLGDAGKFKPYSDDPDAPMIDPDLAEDIRLTRETISRHESNLEKFQTNEDQVIARFEGDINRFKSLKGIE